MIFNLLIYTSFAQDFSKLDQLIEQQIKDKVFPGAVVGIYYDKLQYVFRYGNTEYEGDPEILPMNKTTIFDMASVTKVVAATTAAMQLWEKGLLDVEEYVSTYIPEFPHQGVKISNLLLHNSGLPPDAPLGTKTWTKESILKWLYEESTLTYPTGTKYVYSDLSMVTLQQVIERITNLSLDVYLQKNVFQPFQMQTSFFNPPKELQYRIAPTQRTSGSRGLIWGQVHDPTAYFMGGVSGNAGLFSTVYDLLTFMRIMNSDNQVFSKATLDFWLKAQVLDAYENRRSYGWDTVPIQTYPPCGSKFSRNSFGHTGYTGTSVWADRETGLIIVILTNRVYPNDSTSVVKFRYDASDIIVNALGINNHILQ